MPVQAAAVPIQAPPFPFIQPSLRSARRHARSGRPHARSCRRRSRSSGPEERESGHHPRNPAPIPGIGPDSRPPSRRSRERQPENSPASTAGGVLHGTDPFCSSDDPPHPRLDLRRRFRFPRRIHQKPFAVVNGPFDLTSTQLSVDKQHSPKTDASHAPKPNL